MSTFIYLQKERERSLLRRHPWVFSKAIENVKGKVAPGAPVEIFSHDGRWLARGAWSPESRTNVATMGANDFRSNELSVTLPAATTVTIEHVATDGAVIGA